jgi:hypothetical protein
MLTAFHLAGRLRGGVLLGCGAMAQLVARLHGMQKVRGSNPLSSTGFPDLCSVVKYQAKDLSVLDFLVALVGVFVAEDVVHHCRSATDGGNDHVPVDGLGDVG